MKKVPIVSLALALIAGFAFAGGGRDAGPQGATQSAQAGAAAQPSTISIGGSTSVTPLAESFQAEYARLHPNVTITISGTGSGDGIRGAGDGIYDIGMSSRSLTPAELGAGLNPITIAIDGIALIVHPSSPITNLTTEQVRDIYTGDITQWQQLGAAANGKTGGIAVISREPGSGTRGAFQEILNYTDANLATNANILDGTGAVRSSVAGNPSAIGYISIGSLNDSVKALNINGHAPTDTNVVNGSYTIARPFIFITRHGHTPTAATQAFLDWSLSNAGQTIVSRNYVRVN